MVERAEARFAPGLNVLTGETGAGKSVLMGALALVTGARADPESVRDGAKEAEVEADFDGTRVRRTITREGRSRAWIDEESVSVSELRDFALGRVDIHGARSNQRIYEEAFQRSALDSFAGKAKTVAAYARAYAAWRSAAEALAALEADLGGEDEADMLRYQVGELEEAAIGPEDDDLAARHAAAAHAEEIVEGANAVSEALGGDRGVAETLARLQPEFARLRRHLPEAEEWAARSEEITVAVQELSRSVADVVSRLDAGEENLEELDRRLSLVSRLERKYKRADAAGMVALLGEKKARLAAIDGREEALAARRGEVDRALAELKAAAAELTKARRSAAKRLAAAVVAGLRDLGFRQAVFEVRLGPAEPAAHGADAVAYYFGPNPGEAVRPLASIASSGEAARVMLALKAALAEHDATGTLVFDEIDANVGGEVGEAVGRRLRELAATHQVITITHLPQSAVWGERHLVVGKRVSGGRTRTEISEVSGEARVTEIARMLGGENKTTVVRKHAQELLSIPG